MFGILIILFSFLVFFFNFYWKRRNLPPGPTPWPLIGNVNSMFKNAPDDVYMKWRKQFGDVYTYWNGENPVVAVCGYEVIIDTFIKDGESYVGRPDSDEFLEIMKNGKTGVVFTEGDLWRDHRRFTLTVLRDLGLGKNIMQKKILEEYAIMANNINEDRKNGIVYHNIEKHVDIAIASLISNLIFGFSYTADAEKAKDFQKMKISLHKVEEDFDNPLAFILMSKAHRYKHFPFLGTVYKSLVKHRDIIFEALQKIVDIKRKEMNFNNNESNDYVEAFLMKQYELENNGIQNHSFT